MILLFNFAEKNQRIPCCMKTVLVICDGMDEAPLEVLGGVTPKDYVSGEGFRELYSGGLSGRFHSTPLGFTPGSEVAILSILGYAPSEIPPGRASLEAAGSGIEFNPGDIAFRCNIVRFDNGKLVYPSVSLDDDTRAAIFRTLTGIKVGRGGIGLISCSPSEDLYLGRSPYDSYGAPVADSALPEIAVKAHDILSARNYCADQSVSPNGIWIWSGAPVRTFRYFPRKAAIIAAVPLVKGIGKLTGMEVIDVEGATGRCDTDFRAKTAAAISALDEYDFVIIHVEACDEAAHRRSLLDKLEAISSIDRDIIVPLLREASVRGDIALAVISDHHTSSVTGKHSSDPVGFAIKAPSGVAGSLGGELHGREFIDLCTIF